jgi:hypothetical protein
VGTVHGDAEAGSQNWSMQQYDNDCGLMSLAHLIGLLTGDTPSEEDIIAQAADVPSVIHDGPVYVKPDGSAHSDGLVPNDAVPLAERYGVNVVFTWDEDADETGWATGMTALKRYLDSSGAAIAGVDADILGTYPAAASVAIRCWSPRSTRPTAWSISTTAVGEVVLTNRSRSLTLRQPGERTATN